MLNYIKNFKISININFSKYILQYSAIETAYIGLPILYSNESSLYNIIGDSIFCYSSADDLISKIKFFYTNNNLDNYKNIYQSNNNIINNEYDFENIKSDYILNN